MSAPDRRRLLLMAGALLPALASRPVFGQPLNGPLERPRAFAPPARQMVYTRRLVRELAGGAQMSVERRFAVRFEHLPGGGFLVEGEQIGVEVAAPDKLARLAELERQRIEHGIFPVHLDARGWIVSGTLEEDVPAIQAAFDHVMQAVETLDISAQERAGVRDFIAAIHQAGGTIISSLPTDLFAPADGDRTDRREITLPMGEGTIATHFTARRNLATGLMEHARREVITSLADEKRRTTEEFTLAG